MSKDASCRGAVFAIALALGFSSSWMPCAAAAEPTVAKRRPELVLQAGQSGVLLARFSPDGKILATGSIEGSIVLWDAQTGRQLRELVGHYNTVFSMAFSPDGKMLATGSTDGTGEVLLWNVQTGERLRRFGGHLEVRSLAFSVDGRLMAAGSDFGQVVLWETESGRKLATLLHGEKGEGCLGFVTSIAFSGDGTMLATGAEGPTMLAEHAKDKTVILWDLRNNTKKQALEKFADPVRVISFSPDGMLLAIEIPEAKVEIWNTVTCKKDLQLDGLKDSAIELPPGSNGMAIRN